MLTRPPSFVNHPQIHSYNSNQAKMDKSEEKFYFDEDIIKGHFQAGINTQISQEKRFYEKNLYKTEEDIKYYNNNASGVLGNRFSKSKQKNRNKVGNGTENGANLINPPKNNRLKLKAEKNKQKREFYIRKNIIKYINKKNQRIKFLIYYKKLNSYKYIIKPNIVGNFQDYENLLKTEINKLFEFYDFFIDKKELINPEMYIYIIYNNTNQSSDVLDSNNEDFGDIISNKINFRNIFNFPNIINNPEDILIPENCEIVANLLSNKERNNSQNLLKNPSNLKYFLYSS